MYMARFKTSSTCLKSSSIPVVIRVISITSVIRVIRIIMIIRDVRNIRVIRDIRVCIVGLSEILQDMRNR